MAILGKNCPKCGGILDDNGSCPKCGYSTVIGISGISYQISSATWSSPSFSKIADTFGNNLNERKNKNELTSIEYIDEETLADYVKWGYLQKTSDDVFGLTERGKESVKKNKKNRGIE